MSDIDWQASSRNGPRATFSSRSQSAMMRSLVATAIAVIPFVLGSCAPADGSVSTPHATSQADAVARLATCLKDRGWEVSAVGDSIGIEGVPDEQMDRYSKDTDECSANLYPDPAKFTSAQWQELYDLMSQTATCLEEKGYHTGERPSLQAFKDSGGEWNPYPVLLETGQITGAKIVVLDQECPQPDFWG